MAVSKYLSTFPIGKQIEEWTVIGEPVMDDSSRAKIPVRCSCGEETEVYAYHLSKGNSTRCKKCTTGKSDAEYGLRGKTYRSAVAAGVQAYSLSASDLSESFSQQHGTCAISGDPLEWTQTAVVRYSNEEGFTPENTCLVTKTTFTMMNNMSVQEFQSFCENVTEKNPIEEFFNRREKDDK